LITTVSALAIDGAATAIAPSAAITYPSFLIFSSSIEWGIKSAGRRNVPREPQENSERLFSFGIVSSKFERGTQLAMRYSMIA
jgi:hypothetical protein